MPIKFAILIVLMVCALAIAGSVKGMRIDFSSFDGQQQQPLGNQGSEDPTTLRARIKPARARGAQKAVFPGPIPWYEAVRSLGEALARYTVVIAQPVEKRSFMPGPRDIQSIYKLKVIDTLSRANVSGCCVPTDLPAGLTPLNENEIYLWAGGGTVQLDGVETTVEDEFGGLSTSRQYLLFLKLDPSGKIGMVTLGPRGVFKINPNGVLESIVNDPHVLKRDIEKGYGNSVNRMSVDLKRLPGAQ